MPIRSIVSLLVVLVPLPGFSQEPIPQSFLEGLARDLATLQAPPDSALRPFSVRMVESAPVYAGAGTDTREIGRLRIGDEAPVIDNAGSWYAIQLPNEASGWVQARNVAPVLKTFLSDTEAAKLAAAKARALGGTDQGWFQDNILSLLERASAFRESYQDNPYVTVSGFDISLSITGPSLGMSFEFKE
jgi:hypothetical protein